MVRVKIEPGSSAHADVDGDVTMHESDADSFNRGTMPNSSYPTLNYNFSRLATAPMGNAAPVVIKQEALSMPASSLVTTAGGGGSSSGHTAHSSSSVIGANPTTAAAIQTPPVGPAVPAAAGGRAAQQAFSVSSSEDRHRYIQMQQRWLLFMRHCAKCQQDEGGCQFSLHCKVGQDLWAHMLQCNDPACAYPRCTSTKDLLKHTQKCQKLCPICTPVKEYTRRMRMRTQGGDVPEPPATPSQPGASHFTDAQSPA